MTSSSRVRSAERVLDILRHLADADGPQTTMAIAQALDLPKSTAHHLLNVMRDRGFLTYLPDRRSWAIGPSAFAVGAGYARNESLQHEAGPFLAQLGGTLGLTSHLAVLQGTDVLYLAKHEPPSQGVRLVTEVGSRLPAHLTAVGRAMLAHLSPETLETVYRGYHWPVRTGSGPKTLAEVKALLAEVARCGVADERDNTTSGIRCIASAVVVGGQPVAALGVTFVDGLLAPQEADAVKTEVRTAAGELTAHLVPVPTD